MSATCFTITWWEGVDKAGTGSGAGRWYWGQVTAKGDLLHYSTDFGM